MSKFKFFALIIIFAMVLSACAPKTEAPSVEEPAATEAPAEKTEAPVATEAPAETETPAEATEAPAAEEGVQEIPREQTLILGWSIASPIGVTNPWAVPGYTHQEGNNFLWEPLYYFGIFSDKEIPWLAESMEYTNDDFTELEIKLNPKAKWSDGEPVTAKDVVFTFDGQMKDDKLPYHGQFDQFVESYEAVDDQTVVVKFKQPAPRFKFEVLTLKFDTGIPIVPAHVLEAQDDIHGFAGGLDMPHSGPYTLVNWDKDQKIFDLRPDWWAVEAGLIEEPAVKRIIMVNLGGQIGQNMDTIAQRIVNGEMDSALDMRSSLIKSILEQSNGKVTSYTGNEPPYGYLDWWPNSLWVNTQLAPYSDPNVRRAMSLSIDRDMIDQVVYDGAKISTIYPFPLYPGLQKFVDSPDVQAQIEKYQPRKFDLDESAKLMEEAGFTKNGDGLWEKDGETINATINGFEGIHSDIAPVLVEMLRKGGFDASVNFGSDAYQNMVDGAPGLYMWGHGASLKDPYAALELFHGKYSAAIGTTAGTNRWSRYSNPEYDAILDKMAPLSSDDPEFQKLAAEALGIYWRDTIDIPIIQWLHRIPYGEYYWTNWPTKDNLAAGTNGAFWAQTGMLVVTHLKPVTP